MADGVGGPFTGATPAGLIDRGVQSGRRVFELPARFNTRRAKFADARVRRALLYAFDAERINQQMFHGRYQRSTSFFSRSGLASS